MDLGEFSKYQGFLTPRFLQIVEAKSFPLAIFIACYVAFAGEEGLGTRLPVCSRVCSFRLLIAINGGCTMCMCMYTCSHYYMYMYMYTCTYIYIYIYIHVQYIHVCILYVSHYVHIYIYIYMNNL